MAISVVFDVQSQTITRSKKTKAQHHKKYANKITRMGVAYLLALALGTFLFPAQLMAQEGQPLSIVADNAGPYEDRVRFSWTGAVAQTSFIKVKRDDDVIAVLPPGQAAFEENPPAFDIPYTYSISEVRSDNSESDPVVITGFKTLFPATSVRVSDGLFTDRVEISWENNSAIATNYQIFRRETGETTIGNVIALLTADTEFYLDESAEPGVSYEYLVQTVHPETAADPTPQFVVGSKGFIPALLSVEASDGEAKLDIFLRWVDPGNRDDSNFRGKLQDYVIKRNGIDITRASTLFAFENLGNGVMTVVDQQFTPGNVKNEYCIAILGLKVVDGVQSSETSAEVCDEGEVRGPLPTPTAVEASNRTIEDHVLISWENPSELAVGYSFADKSGFEIKRRKANDSTLPPFDLIATIETTETRFEDVTAEPGIDYEYCLMLFTRFESVLGALNNNESEEACITGARAGVLPPSAVSGSLDTFEDKIEVSWENPSGVASLYRLFRDGELYAVLPRMQQSFTDYAVASDQGYFYCVENLGVVEFESALPGKIDDLLTSNRRDQLSLKSDLSGNTTKKLGPSTAPDELATLQIAQAQRLNTLIEQAAAEERQNKPSLSNAPTNLFISKQVCGGGRRSIKSASNISSIPDAFENHVQLSWTDNSDVETGYEIYRKNDAPRITGGMRVANDGSIDFSGDFTIEMWIRHTGQGNFETLMAGSEKGISGLNYLFGLNHIGGDLYTILLDGTQSGEALSPAPVILKNETWNHVAVTRKGLLKSFYQNGQLIGESSIELNISSAGDQLTFGNTFSGYMSNIRLWNTARTADEIGADYDQVLLGDEEGLMAYWPINEGPRTTSAIDRVEGLEGTLPNSGWVLNGGPRLLLAKLSADRTSYGDYTAASGLDSEYEIQAYDALGHSMPATIKGQRTLKAPTGLVATDGASETEIILTWVDNSRAEKGYRVIRDGSVREEFLLPRNTTRFVDTGHNPGASYTYRVAAIDDAGHSFPATDIGSTMVLPPASVNATETYTDKVVISWEDQSSLNDGYVIVRDPPFFDTRPDITQLGPDATSFTDEQNNGLKFYGGATYCVVATFDEAQSEQVCDTGRPIPPTNPTTVSTFDLGKILQYIPAENAASVGSSISTHGRYTIVGGKANLSTKTGSAYIFEFDNKQWNFVQALPLPTLPGDEKVSSEFASAVAINGVHALVSDPGAGNNGKVHVYILDNNAWVFAQTIAPNEDLSGIEFGTAVALSTTSAFIGAPKESEGMVYVYPAQLGAWSSSQKLKPQEALPGEIFGSAIAADDAFVLIGAPGDKDRRLKGSAYVFATDGTSFSQEAHLEHPNGSIDDRFGHAVAIDRDHVIIGANKESVDNKTLRGAAHIFKRENISTAISWRHTARLIGEDQANVREFGSSVSIKDGIAIAGAPLSQSQSGNVTSRGAGSSHIFRMEQLPGNQEQWLSLASLSSPNTQENEFGSSVVVAQNSLLIGAARESRIYQSVILSTPLQVAATSGQFPDRIQLSWLDNNAQEEGYHVYRRNEKGVLDLIQSLPADAELFDDFNAVAGSGYEYCVSAFNHQPSDQDYSRESAVACASGSRPANGTISGLITTEGGVGTEEVDVCLTPSPNLGLMLDGYSEDNSRTGSHAKIDALFQSLSSIGSLTLEFWVKTHATNDAALLSYLDPSGNKNFNISNPKDLTLSINETDFSLSNATATTPSDADPIINDGAWHHVAIVIDGTLDQIGISIDGKMHLIERANIQNLNIVPGGLLVIGQDQDSPGFWNEKDEAFRGEIDELRLWSIARSEAQIQAFKDGIVNQDATNLIGYWTFDEGTRNVAADQSASRSNALLFGGAHWTDEGAPLSSCATTDDAGNYTINGLRYGETTEYTVTPMLANRTFGPAFKKITLTTESPIQNEVEFLDNSAFTVAGVIEYEGSSCAVPDAQVFLADSRNGAIFNETLETTTEADGTFRLAVLPSDNSGTDLRRIRVTLGSESDPHRFEPDEQTLDVKSDLNEINFVSTKLRALTGNYQGGGGACSIDIGTAKLRVFTEDGCFDKTFDITGQQYDIELPPQQYLVQLIPETIPDELVGDVTRFFSNLGVQQVDLTNEDAEMDFIFRAKPTISIAGLDAKKPNSCSGGTIALVSADDESKILRSLPIVPVIKELESVNLEISVVEDYGTAGTCAVDAATLTIFDTISDLENPIQLTIEDGLPVNSGSESISFEQEKFLYTTKGASPNTFTGAIIDGTDRSLQKSITAVAEVAGVDAISVTEWVLVEGARLNSSTFVSATTDPIPMMMLQDPPGDNSYAYIEEGTSVCERISSVSLLGGGAGPDIDFVLGFRGGIGVEGGVGVALRARTVIGEEVTELSGGACPSAGGLAAVAAAAAVTFALPQTIPLIPILLPSVVEECDPAEIPKRNLEVCMTTTERWSTLDSWTGENLFAGVALNLEFATMDKLEENACKVSVTEVLGMDFDEQQPFNTSYVYGSTHIEKSLIPSLEELEKLGDNIEVTGERADNGTSETVTLVRAIENWNNHLEQAETMIDMGVENKCAVVEDGEVVEKNCAEVPGHKQYFNDGNRSFSAGTNYEKSIAIDTTRTTYARASRIYINSEGNIGAVATITGYDSEFIAGFEVNREFVNEHDSTQSTGQTIGYVLSDDDTGDYFTVDVGTNPIYNTPVFKTISGRSSNPWEGPATQKRDLPEISIDPPLRDGVDPSEAANFTITLTNKSESKERRQYSLAVPGETNPGNAGLTVTGDLLGGARLETFTLAGDESKSVSLDVFKGPNAYNYEDLAVILYPQDEYDLWLTDTRQSFALSDTAWFSVRFNAPCSDITIDTPIENWRLNAANDRSKTSVLLSGFGLQISESSRVDKIGLEYRTLGGDSWRPAVDIDVCTDGNTDGCLPIDQEDWAASWDASSLSDGTYELRAFTSCSAENVVYSNLQPGFVDAEHPRVLSTPEPADKVLALGEDIVIEFDEPIACSSVLSSGTEANAKVQPVDGPNAGQNLAVSSSCKDNTLVLKPNEDELDDAEGLTLKAILETDGANDITDLAGNPVPEKSWSFKVNRSALAWNPANVRIGNGRQVTSTLINGLAEAVNFDLTGIPAWLSTSTEQGALPPGEQIDITFDVNLDAQIAADTILAQTGQWNARLFFSCYAPDWTFSTAGLSETMLVTASIVDETGTSLGNGTNDVLAAFHTNVTTGLEEVRGLAYPDPNSSTVKVLVHGKGMGEIIGFRYWDASDCKLYQIEETHPFGSADIGADEAPVQMSGTTEIREAAEIAFDAGWTWFSINRGSSNLAVDDVLGTLAPNGNDLIKSQTAFSLFNPGSGSWIGSLSEIDQTRSYRVRLQEPGTIRLTGGYSDPGSSIDLNAGWNWLGYVPRAVLPINEALAGLGAFGIHIKSQHQFADYDAGSNSWIGSLTHMRPGEGYMIEMAQEVPLFAYPQVTGGAGKTDSEQTEKPAVAVYTADPLMLVSSSPTPNRLDALTTTAVADSVDAPRSAAEKVLRYAVFHPADYDFNMAMQAVVNIDGVLLSDPDALVWITASENPDTLRGIVNVSFVEAFNDHRLFMMVYGNLEQEKELDLHVFDPVNDKVITLPSAINFVADSRLGTSDDPFVIEAGDNFNDLPKSFALEQNYPNPFNPQTSIYYDIPEQVHVKILVFDVLGREVATLVDDLHEAGSYDFQFDASHLSSGVYFYAIEAGAFKKSRKMVLLR